MSEKNWFKVETSKDKVSTYHYYGTSPLSLEQLVAALQRGEFVRLDDLLYMERSQYKEWSEWDKTLTPTVSINPACVVTVMQFKTDPRANQAK
jgi:hypothetical protein